MSSFSVFRGRGESSRCKDHERRACAVCTFDLSSEHCFMQWNELLNCSAFPLNDMDSAVSCSSMGWRRNHEVPGILELGREYGLVPVKSIRGMVHVARKHAHPEKIHNFNPLKKEQRRWVAVVGGATCIFT